MNKFLPLIAGLIILGAIGIYSLGSLTVDKVRTERSRAAVQENRMLLVLSAPSIHDTYYEPAFQRIVDFHINYANAVLEHGADDVVILVDADTFNSYWGLVPDEVLLTTDVEDIWMRDFTTVNPYAPTQFTYTWASMSHEDSKVVQGSFDVFADGLGIERSKTKYLIDGGNVVDNYAGDIIVTTRFMEDNNLTYTEAKEALKAEYGAERVAIIEPDEDALAHSDGMVMWLDEQTLLVNDYSSFGREFQDAILGELEESFPDVNIIEVPVEYGENAPGEWEGFSSACGVNLNAVLTETTVYVPTFGMAHDARALEIIRANTDKHVIEIEANGVCPMGGSVRCLTWQIANDNAKKIINAAQE